MLNLVEHEQNFITSGPVLASGVFKTRDVVAACGSTDKKEAEDACRDIETIDFVVAIVGIITRDAALVSAALETIYKLLLKARHRSHRCYFGKGVYRNKRKC